MGTILIVGGGIGGMAAAIRLAEDGNAVELVDIDPEWRVYGAGITITGPTLRAYKRLGLLEPLKRQGAITNGVRIFRYGGIMRPVLHHIMQQRIRSLDIPVRLGLTVASLADDGAGVDVEFSDRTKGRYDLVVGADSIYSAVRDLAFPHMAPAVPTGQGCWRISMQRPEGFDRGEFYLGHAFPCGITACSADRIYVWMLTPHVRRKRHFSDEDLFTNLHANLADFGGTIAWVRENMTRDDWINYRPLSAAIQPTPWYTGRIVLLGDAVHATTPHLASGAGMAVESALVLADELARHGDVESALGAYQERRFARCSDVVETSVAVGRLQLAGGAADKVSAMIGGALHRLAEEY
jgi:2-polyprenyl-6-methoxyphenol hydroxylase-like FAD-dependent oxidoreductase